MNFFKRDKTTTDTPPSSGLSPVYTPSASLTGKTASTDDIQQARESVDFMVGELKASADQQQLAAKRMSSLNKTISKMEAGLRHVDRLETETAQLRNDLQSTAKKLEQKTNWASEQENKLINLERQHNDIRQQLESAKADIAQRKDREAADRDKLVKQGRDIETLSSLDKKSKASDTAEVELKNLRLDFNEMKTKYFETNAALENAKYDLKTQKNVYEDTLKRRDDETLAHKSRIEQLNTQVRIKDNMSTHFDEEIITLRNQLETERERNDRNEMRFRGKVNMVQKQKLERYAAIGGITAGSSMIAAEAARADAAAKYPVLSRAIP